MCFSTVSAGRCQTGNYNMITCHYRKMISAQLEDSDNIILFSKD